ncbi:MAG: hypothetical protein IPO05_18635 [Flavobacteriales bacterium]|nr:hypothetical protein [Flavobacteriales bacterium]
MLRFFMVPLPDVCGTCCRTNGCAGYRPRRNSLTVARATAYSMGSRWKKGGAVASLVSVAAGLQAEDVLDGRSWMMALRALLREDDVGQLARLGQADRRR